MEIWVLCNPLLAKLKNSLIKRVTFASSYQAFMQSYSFFKLERVFISRFAKS